MKTLSKILMMIALALIIGSCSDLSEMEELTSLNNEVPAINDGGLKTTPPPCSEETAWAITGELGTRYTERGSWAMYSPYVEGKSFLIYAGNDFSGYIGYITLIPSNPEDGTAEIWIKFFDSWCFQDVEEPLKIQGYTETPPNRNPRVGRFETFKGYPDVEFQGDQKFYTAIIDLDDKDEVDYIYYGIHLDVGCCD